MPLPMVHLAVAVRIHEMESRVPSPAFLLGSIAPDAIHMRSGTGRDDKRRVHLVDPHDPSHERIRALWAQHWRAGSESPDFAKGYATHLLTDRLWAETVFSPFREHIPQGLSDQERRSLYYRETDQIDFDLYHRVPWRAEVWRRLAAAEPVSFGSLLTAKEIELWRDRTLDWFEKLKQEPGIEPVYITYTDVYTFIDRAADLVGSCFADPALGHLE